MREARRDLLRAAGQIRERLEVGRTLERRDAPAEQIAALRRWRQRGATRKRRDGQSNIETVPRPSRAAAPFLQLGDNRAKIAARLRAEVPSERRHAVAEELRALAEDLLRDEE